MIVAGIDPGLKGGIAFIDTLKATIEIHEMPIIAYKKKTLVYPKGVASIFRNRCVHVTFLERVWSRPTDGVVSAGNLLEGKGILLGVLAANEIDVKQVSPKVWQNVMQCPAAAQEAVTRGETLFPNAAHLFRGPRGGPRDGLAESAMIALYGCLVERRSPKKSLELINEQEK